MVTAPTTRGSQWETRTGDPRKRNEASFAHTEFKPQSPCSHLAPEDPKDIPNQVENFDMEGLMRKPFLKFLEHPEILFTPFPSSGEAELLCSSWGVVLKQREVRDTQVRSWGTRSCYLWKEFFPECERQEVDSALRWGLKF